MASKKKVTIRLSLVSLMAVLIFTTSATILGVSALLYRNSINWVLEALSQKVVAHVIDRVLISSPDKLDTVSASAAIREIDLSSNGKILLLDENFTILASVERKDDELLPDRFMGREIKLNDSGDELLVRSFEKFKANVQKKNRSVKLLKRKFDHFPFWYDFQKYFAIYIDFQTQTGKEYYAGVVVPYRDYFSSLTRNNIILYSLVVLFVAISIYVSLRMSKRISSPLTILAQETEKIRNFDLQPGNNIESPILEVENMAESIDRMRSGLKSFQKYVPSDLVRELIHMGKEATLGGEKKNLTVFFSDIAGFTSISERLSPEDLVNFLGEYLGNMTRILMQNKGTVDKYIGDAIMAFWGAPLDMKDHAYRACTSALKFQEAQEVMREAARKKGHPDFFSRIGINTGDLIVGNMGYEDRMNYTVIGDTVNLASRIEGINKNYGTRILIGEQTHAQVASEFDTRYVDLVAVKGKETGVGIYELIGKKGEMSSNRASHLEFYEKAFHLYLQAKFEAAQELFHRAKSFYPEDLACEIFIKRCTQFIEAPPGDNWNGVFISKEK
ncbi:MAG: adenylate/guanylate cyclase domain-containing protein [Leptospiraceae bacterium]|nr:adenylate/guanylate cyclase domain-containing protein [Leptospiraceae bacterium]